MCQTALHIVLVATFAGNQSQTANSGYAFTAYHIYNLIFYSMANLRFLFSALALASLVAVSAQTIVPGAPKLSMNFVIEEGVGKVTGTITAPSKDNQYQDLPAGTLMNVRVVRSCWSLGESDVAVVTAEGLNPNEEFNFTENAVPAWQYGYSYTYYAYASIDGGQESYQGYGSCSPGIHFSFGYQDVTATPRENDGNFFVDIAALVPDKTSDSAEPLTIDMTALEIYRYIGDSYSSDMELIKTIPNPEKGSTQHFVDENPVPNSMNRYLVKCVSEFGFTQTDVQAYVGFDIPAAPYPVAGEWLDDGGYRISWTAPVSGVNYGAINPEETSYNVYRCWGRSEDERKLIAAGIKETEYVDYGTDMDVPRAVMYMVEAFNNVGVGGSTSSSYAFDVLIGPDYRLPFVETFDGDASHVWSFTSTSYYTSFSISEYAEYGSDYTRVEPVSGTHLIYASSPSWGSASSNATMTSYKIDMSGAVAPHMSYYVYMIPGCDVIVKPQISADGGEFVDLPSVNVGECEDAGWRQFTCDLSDYAGTGYVNVCFNAGFTSTYSAAIIDEIRIIDYPAVANISVEYDSEACSAVLTWDDPSTEYAVVTGYEGIIDGNSVGAVEMPWVFRADDYRTPYVISVKAVYGEISGPESAPVTVSVPRPVFTEFTVDDHVFSIVQGPEPGVNQVTVKSYLGSAAFYKVPELVTYDDVTYSVIAIGEGAYRENQSIVSVNIPESVAVIGEEAFYGCREMLAVAFGAGLEKIEARAFANCSSLSTVTFVSDMIPEVAVDAFLGIADSCAGKCPEGMEGAYSAVEGLAPISFGISDIDTIYSDGVEKVEYYDFSGIRLTSPAIGTPVIVRAVMSDGSVRIFRIILR